MISVMSMSFHKVNRIEINAIKNGRKNLMNKESLQAKIEQLTKQSNDLEAQINELYSKQSRIQDEIADYHMEIEKLEFNGMTRREYLKSIEGTTFTEGEYIITIGARYPNTLISVVTMEEDMRLTVSGNYNSEQASLELHRSAVPKDNIRRFDKTYYLNEIPKSRKEKFDIMNALRIKYGQMVANAEIKPQEVR